MENQTTILHIHGGMTFKNKQEHLEWLKTKEISIEKRDRWSGGYFDKKLGKDFYIIRPRMPLPDDAKYEEWKIVFERYFALIEGDIILTGESLGGIFLAKYLSENKLPKKVLSAYLICPPFDNDLIGEDLVGGFKLSKDLSMIYENTQNLYLMFSADDDVVPVAHAEKYRKKLPDANIIIYDTKNGHFNVAEFPEIIKMIKKDVNNK